MKLFLRISLLIAIVLVLSLLCPRVMLEAFIFAGLLAILFAGIVVLFVGLILLLRVLAGVTIFIEWVFTGEWHT